MAVMVSCSDQLELYPETNLTEGNYYNTEEELSLAANDAYRQLCRIYNANGLPDLFGERFSDNVCVIFTDGGNTYTEDIVLHKIKSLTMYYIGWKIHLSLLRLMSF